MQPGIQNTLDSFKAGFFTQIARESQNSMEGFIGMDERPMAGEDLKQRALRYVVAETRAFFRSRAAQYRERAARRPETATRA